MRIKHLFPSLLTIIFTAGVSLSGATLLPRSEAEAIEQESPAATDEVRFPVAHQHKGNGWCMGYLYINHHSIRYEVVRPEKDKNHSFDIPRAELKSIGQLLMGGKPEQATRIETKSAVYHFWWMPNEDDLQPGKPSKFKPDDAAAPGTLIKALRHPATVLGGKSDSGKLEEPKTELVGTWSGQHSNTRFTLVLKSDTSGTLNNHDVHWQFSGGTLTLKSIEGTYIYNISVSADSMSLTGNDLKEPMTLKRTSQNNKAPGLFTPEMKVDEELPIPGNPPLTQALVDQSTQFFEWLLDAPFTIEQRTEFRESLVRSWKDHHQGEIDSTMNTLKFQDQLNSKTKQERELVREQLSEKFLAGMRQNPNDTLSKWVLNIYDSAHHPIAKGNPPLTSQVADAYAEVVAFMARECLGKQAFNANRQFKDKLAKKLVGQYSGYSAEQQQQFAQMPLLWKTLRYQWAKSSDKEKQSFRKQWAPTAKTLLSGVTGQPAAGQQAVSSEECSSPELSCNSGYSEHQFVENMANSSFASSISMHMNVFHH